MKIFVDKETGEEYEVTDDNCFHGDIHIEPVTKKEDKQTEEWLIQMRHNLDLQGLHDIFYRKYDLTPTQAKLVAEAISELMEYITTERDKLYNEGNYINKATEARRVLRND